MDPSAYLSFTAPDFLERCRADPLFSPARSGGASTGFLTPSVSSRKKKKLSGLLCFPRPHPSTRSYLTRDYLGASLVLFGGRVVIGPQRSQLAVSMLLLLVSGLRLNLVLAPALEEETRSTLALSLFVLSVIFMVLTACSDPGIIPRDLKIDPQANPFLRPHIDPATSNPRARHLLLNGVAIKQKWCRTCNLYRPPRSHHCSVCDNCVMRFDHHCAFLGTCVGLGNYRWFLILVWVLTAFSVLVAESGIAYMVKMMGRRRGGAGEGGPYRSHVLVESDEAPSGVIGFIIAFYSDLMLTGLGILCGFALLILGIYHVFITSHNVSTNEHVKRYYRINPFDMGPKANLFHTCCIPDKLLPDDTGGLSLDASYSKNIFSILTMILRI